MYNKYFGLVYKYYKYTPHEKMIYINYNILKCIYNFFMKLYLNKHQYMIKIYVKIHNLIIIIFGYRAIILKISLV